MGKDSFYNKIIKNIHVPVRVIKFEYDPICFGNAIVDVEIDCFFVHCVSEKSQFFNQIHKHSNVYTIETLSNLINKQIVLDANDFSAYVNKILLFINDNLELIKSVADVASDRDNSNEYSTWYKELKKK